METMSAIVKYEAPRDWCREYYERLFMMFLTRNAHPAPEPDGSFYVGPIEEEVPEKNWSRPTPYSLASKNELKG